jgi:O-antigen/teichoic acid export membrane protein
MTNSACGHPQVPFKRRLVKNILSNWAGYAVGIIVTFLLTPYVIKSMGPVRYGIWILANALTGYYGLLDLGFRSGVNQYLTRNLAKDDLDNLNGCASTGFLALAACGAIVLAVSIAVTWLVPVLFTVPTELIREMRIVIMVMGAISAVQFVFFTYSAVFTALQRFDISNGIGISTRLLTAVMIVAALNFDFGLVGISIASACGSLIDYLVRWRVALTLLPSLRISPSLVNRRNFTEITSFSFWNFMIAAGARMISYTDALVIAAFMPVAAVVPFALAAGLRSQFEAVFELVGYVFFPVATEMDSTGRLDDLRRLYLTGSRGMILLSIAIGSVSFLLSGDFFRLWVGPEIAEPAGYPGPAFLFNILLFGSIADSTQRIGYQVLLGMRRMRLLVVLFVSEGVLNLLMSLGLIRTWGLLGVAVGTLLPALIFQGFAYPCLICRVLEIRGSSYVQQVLLRPGLVALVLSAGLIIFGHVKSVTGWPSMALWTAAVSCFALFCAVMLGLDAAERRVILFSPAAAVTRLRAVIVPLRDEQKSPD